MKKTQGRQKIPMKLIEDEKARRITFSKRRNGLFKKANELATLCGVQIAIIAYSIGGKAYTFGDPCVESVLNQFQNRKTHHQSHSKKEKDKKQKSCHHHDKSEKNLNDGLEGLDVEELELLKEKLESMTKRVDLEMKQFQNGGSSFKADINVEEMKNVVEGFYVPEDWLKL